MSRAFTVGPRTHTHTAGRAARVNVAKKPSTSRTVGVGNRTRNASTSSSSSSSNQQQAAALTADKSFPKIKSPLASVKTKPSEARTTPVRPRVVTLADLTSGNKKSNASSASRTSTRRTTSTKGSTPESSPVKNCKTSGVKKGKDTNMWDDDSRTPYNTSTSSQRGSRNAIVSNLGNGRQDHGNQASAFGSPGSTLTGRAGDGQAADDADRRGTYDPQGGYTRVAPDPKKRDKLQSQRTEELQRLEAFKEKNKLGHVSMKPARVGGSKISEKESRRLLQQEQANKKYELIRKRQQWADEKKQREDEEFAEKKAKAREQTEINKQTEQQRQRDQHADRQDWIAHGGLERLQGGSEAGARGATYEEEEVEDYEFDESAVDGLANIFPHKSPEKLREMLRAAGGDVNRVIDWLSD